MTILIITHQMGFEADSVIDRLETLKASFIRFNQDDGENISKVGFLESGNKKRVFWGSDDKLVSLTDITHAWFQQPPPFKGQPSDFEQTMQRNNQVAFFEASFNFLSIKWLNKMSDAFRAANKVLQLHLAPSVGLMIPETCISNDPLTVRSFCSGGLCIVKNLNSAWLTQGDDTLISSTKLVKNNWLKMKNQLFFAPSYISGSLRGSMTIAWSY